MARPLFSIRLPAALADALDRIAEHAGKSRSDLVEALITSVEADDRETILKAAVPGASTQKRNLRLSKDARAQLKQLAGELEPAEFLRHLVAFVVATAPPEWRQRRATERNGHEPAPTYRGEQVGEDYGYEGPGNVSAGSTGIVVFAMVVIAGLVALILWLVWRATATPIPPTPDGLRGQLPPGSTQIEAA